MPDSDKSDHSLEDKSLFFYGSLYNRLLDPLIKPARDEIVNCIQDGSSVLDVGCGTGLLCFELKQRKNCRVLGIDLSKKMLDYARSINSYDEVAFLHQDATRMDDVQNDSFDYVVILNIIHELFPDEMERMLRESFRVGRQVVLFDSNVPLPWNAPGIIKRLIEIGFGRDHYPQFQAYLSAGGIVGILDACGYADKTIERTVLALGSSQMVIVVGD